MMRKPKNGSTTGGRSSGGESLEAGEAAVEAAGDDEAAEIGHRDLEAVALALLVGNGEQHQRHRPLGARVPLALDRGELGRLVRAARRGRIRRRR